MSYLFCRVTHGNEPVCDVGEVEVVSIGLVSVFLFGHRGSDYAVHAGEVGGGGAAAASYKGIGPPL